MTFENRIIQGNFFEKQVIDSFRFNGFFVEEIGRKGRKEEFNNFVRFIHGDPTITLARYIPDTLVITPGKTKGIFVECKSSNKNQSNNAIELTALKFYQKLSCICTMVIICDDWNVYYPDSINIFRKGCKAGRTPYGLFAKNSGVPFNDFIRQ